MGNRMQGEGDYESARRFNKEEQDFVKRKFKRAPNSDGNNDDAAGTDDEVPLADDAPTQIRRGRFAGVKQRGIKDE